MKSVIIYASKTGTTKKCAELLSALLPNPNIVDIEKQEINLSDYDLIIIGSAIRIGQINKKIKNLIKANRDILNSKLTAYFICCGFSDDYKSYFDNNIPKELLDTSITYDTFGGEMDISKQKGLDKFIVKMVSKTAEGKKAVKLLETNILKFAEKIKREIK